MAHYAKLDSNNIVIEVISINNEELIDPIRNVEDETRGSIFCENLFGGNWIQTSYNKKTRKNFAGIGFKYDSLKDAFIPPKPFESWTLNEDTCLWEAPISMPTDDAEYLWDEESQQWTEV